MVTLLRIPTASPLLEGMLNLSGRLVPVLRLDLLLNLPEIPVGLYTPLILLKGVERGQPGLAFLVERVSSVAHQCPVLPVDGESSLNGCVRSAVDVAGEIVPLLAPGRLLLQEERQRIAELTEIAQTRLSEWNTSKLVTGP